MPVRNGGDRSRRPGRGGGRPLALLVALGALGAGGCGAPPRPALVLPARTAAPVPVAVTANWRLDADRSELSIRAFRAGALAALGHNHVLLARGLEGRLVVPAAGYAGTRFELALPVAALVVDDADARRAAGEGFDTRPTAADIEGTRQHMLGARLLDALAYPTIEVRGVVGAAQGGALSAEAVVVVRGHEARVVVPLAVAPSGTALEARGAFRITHAELGLTPYSVAFGALSVAEEIEIRFRLVAVPVA
jgi:hypothetical protein